MAWKEHPELDLLIPNLVGPRRYNKRQPCVYCGGQNESKGHVIPKTLYREIDRKIIQMLTVGSCNICNSDKKAKLYTFLRDCLVVDIDVKRHPIAGELFETDFMRTMKEGHTGTFEQFYKGRPVALNRWDGEGLELGWAIEIDDQSLLGAVKYITQGMHWDVFGEVTHRDSVSVYLIPRGDRREFMMRSSGLSLFRGYFRQGEQFTSVFGQSEDGRVLWHHIFFDTMLFIGFSQGSVPTTS